MPLSNKDNKKLQDEIVRIKKTNGTGGLGIEQTSGALKELLKENQQVHVVYDKEICGIAEIDNQKIFHQINLLILKPEYIVFPYAISEKHQIAVIIDTEKAELIVIDSLGFDRSNDENIIALAHQLNCRVIPGKSNYISQLNTSDSWECGVHTVHNIIDAINGKNDHYDIPIALELNRNLQTIVEASMRYTMIEEELQNQRDQNRKEKRDLLEAIESLRDKEGNFRNPNAQDDLRFLADALQIEGWGNLDRKDNPKDNPSRNMTQEEQIREREIEKLIAEYEEINKDDILGIIVLNVLKRGGQYEEVINFHRRALDLGNNIYQSSSSCHTEEDKLYNLGNLYFFLEKYSKAIECYNDALSTTPSDSCLTIYIMSKIGCAYNDIDKYEEAFAYHRQALNIIEQTLHPNHHFVAFTLHDIAAVFRKTAQYDAAIEYNLKSLEIKEKFLGINHFSVVATINNLASIYGDKGDYIESIKYYLTALEITKNISNNEDLSVANINNNLGYAYNDLGEYDIAMEYLRQALVIKSKILGNDHPSIATTLHNLGMVHGDKGNCDTAIEYYLKVLAIRKRTIGINHLSTADTLNNLGTEYGNKREYDTAIEYLEQALVIKNKILENDHPYIANTINNLGNINNYRGNYSTAIEYYLKALEIRKKSLRFEHQSTADTYFNLGNAYRGLKDYKTSLTNYKEALGIYISTVGNNHPSTEEAMRAVDLTNNIINSKKDNQNLQSNDSNWQNRINNTSAQSCVII